MRKPWAFFIMAASFLSSCKGKADKNEPLKENNQFIQQSLSRKSNELIISVRDNKIEKSKAVKELAVVLAAIKKEWQYNKQRDYGIADWFFPIAGYGLTAIGGEGGSGYVGHHDFFDGNKHTGHTALDIFISDRNQDCIDDYTKRKIPILSSSGGVVLATAFSWDTASQLRGGKYIYIYDPSNNYLIYYAHNNDLLVKLGQIVKPGDTIATCGRTGLNAFKKRSPTHLHFMLLKLDENNYPKPVNPYSLLLKAKTQ